MKFIARIEAENGKVGRIVFDAENHDAAMKFVKDLLEGVAAAMDEQWGGVD